jgi:hypothetical protein
MANSKGRLLPLPLNISYYKNILARDKHCSLVNCKFKTMNATFKPGQKVKKSTNVV